MQRALHVSYEYCNRRNVRAAVNAQNQQLFLSLQMDIIIILRKCFSDIIIHDNLTIF